MIINEYAKSPTLRGALRDGMIGFAAPRLLIMVPVSQTLLMLALSFPVWFFGRCVFLDGWQGSGDSVCSPIPMLSVGTWLLFIVILLGLSVTYVALCRHSVRQNLVLRAESFAITLADAFALLSGLGIGFWWANSMFDGTASSWGRLIGTLAGPGVAWLWRLHLALWMRWIAGQSAEHEATAVTACLFIQQRLGLERPADLAVTCSRRTLTVVGALDAIDAVRIEDLVASNFPEALHVQLQSTLSDEEYWRSYRTELARTGYVSPPIPEPLQLPAGVFVGLGALLVVLLTVAFRFGPGFAPGISGHQIADFYMTHGMVEPMRFDAPERPEVLDWDALLAQVDSGLDVPVFEIDVGESEAYCPNLTRTDRFSVRRMVSENMLGPYLYPDDPGNTTRYGDIVVRIHAFLSQSILFVIDRSSETCIREHVFTNSVAAERFGMSYPGVLPGPWESVRNGMDWRYVPPLSLESTEG